MPDILKPVESSLENYPELVVPRLFTNAIPLLGYGTENIVHSVIDWLLRKRLFVKSPQLTLVGFIRGRGSRTRIGYERHCKCAH